MVVRFGSVAPTVLALAAGMAAGTASAVEIGFDFVSVNGNTFFSMQEDGFIVAAGEPSGWTKPTGGVGNPSPSIATATSGSFITVARAGGGAFAFSSVDLTGTGGSTTYSFAYLNPDDTWNTYAGGSAMADTWGTKSGGSGGEMIAEMLRITLTAQEGTTSMGLDNINVTAAIPEPQTYAMMLGGLVLLAAVARRRKA